MAPAVIDELRSRVPIGVRHRVAKARLRYRVPTGRWRRLPDAMVIGAQRAGTSSLYRYLGAHPDVSASFRKEVEYFSRYEHLGERWYRAHFDLDVGRRRLTFEATPDYLLHPLAAQRARALVPDAKLVVLLRDPVARAVSHHRHMVRLGYERLDLDAALDAEPGRCGPDLSRLAVDPGHDPKALLRYSYVARGRYEEQLRRWFDHFPRDQFLVIRSEDLFDDPVRSFATVVDFLGLPSWQPQHFANVSRPTRGSGADRTGPGIEARLRETFRAPNAALLELLGDAAPRW
jgi:hypothetical protein